MWLTDGSAPRPDLSQIGHLVTYIAQFGEVFVRLLASYGLLSNKHIPLDLLTESVEVRMQLLVGLIDGAGDLEPKTARAYEVSSQERPVMEGLAYLARSLGFRTGEIIEDTKTCAGYRLQISGREIHTIQTELPYKRASSCKELGIECCDSFTVTQVPHADYYGFQVDGNGRFLLADFVVTHNTDTAVQIMSELYHNFPEQRTLLITHSNHALNDLFSKIQERDIDERYLLRLGRGSEELESESDMSKFGRVNFMLQRRLNLLEEVAALARSLQMSDDVAYTCETAGHFFLYHILARWEKFTAGVQAAQKDGKVDLDSFITANFPFTTYFTHRTEKQTKIWQQYYQTQYGADAMETDAPAAPVTLFRSSSFTEDMSIAVSCFAELQKTFVELEECRPFELLRSYKDRSNYLLTKHAKIIAMTCTHAAIKRKDLVDLKFQFENIIMEESAQILEIETFIPMLLQRADTESGSRLKRIILLGDHHQLPPVIKNRAFQKYSHMDQSLFTRFIRLGMPYIQLNAQGRMRSSLAQLWNWNYSGLGNLPVVNQNAAYQYGNVGFAHEYQLVNVEDLNGVGESSPTPYFYQNLGEAEYVVQTYMYMRLLGYPAHRISILTTYNGQKHLIRDILAQRCASNLLFGLPHKVSTVDKFQGQQNDCQSTLNQAHDESIQSRPRLC
jgi:intron-binding protein aquarius